MKPHLAFAAGLLVLLHGGASEAKTPKRPSASWRTCTADPPRSADNAIAACTAIIQNYQGPGTDLAIAYVDRGIAYLEKGEGDLALRDYNSALTAAPYSTIALVNRAVLFARRGDYDRAIRDYDDAILFQSNFPEAFYNRGALRLKKGELDLALADFTEALRLKPSFTIAHSGKAAVYERKGLTDLAQAELGASGASDVEDATVLNSRCWRRALTGTELEPALADCDKALQLSPGNESYLDSRGLVLLRLGRLEQAIRDYDAALAKDPRKATSLYGRGLAKRRRGDPQGGAADMDMARTIDPKIGETFKDVEAP